MQGISPQHLIVHWPSAWQVGGGEYAIPWVHGYSFPACPFSFLGCNGSHLCPLHAPITCASPQLLSVLGGNGGHLCNGDGITFSRHLLEILMKSPHGNSMWLSFLGGNGNHLHGSSNGVTKKLLEILTPCNQSKGVWVC
jgi:hypothetical protein